MLSPIESLYINSKDSNTMKPQIELKRTQLSNSRHFIWLVYFSIIISIILLSSNTVEAQYNPFTKITDDNFPQYNPAIDGDYVVYEDRRGGGVDDIYLYNIATGTETALTSDPAVTSVHPDISGDRIVWQDNRNGNWDIYTYMISRPDLGAYPLIDFPGDQTSPAIHGNTLVWVDHRGDQFSANIYMYDLSTYDLTQITDDDDLQQNDPDVFEHLIVYGDGRNGNQDIYMYNTYTEEETQLTDDPADQQDPSINGNRVVWEDNRDGNWNLYMHHITFMKGTVYDNYDWMIYTGDVFPSRSNSNEINPCIWGDYIVFQDNRNYHWDLYLYSFFNEIFGHTTPLVREFKNQINPAISNNRIVWQDERDWTGGSYEADIWLWDRPPGADLGITIVDKPDPIVSGNELNYEIFVKNFGTQDATNVVLTNNIPANVDFLRATSAKSGGCSLSGSEVSCNIGDLANGETDTVSIVVRTTTEGILTNTASVTATEDDPLTENNSALAKTTVSWNISTVIDFGCRPSIATDINGKVYVSYISDNYGGNLLFATNKTGAWSSNTLIDSDNIQSHAIAIDKNGYVHIAYGDGDSGHQELMYINNISGDWSNPVTIEPNALNCVSVCIKIDSGNNLHISYMTSPFSNGSLYYLKNATGSWLSELVEQNSYNSSSFDLDTSDYAHFSYYRINWGLAYRTNSPDGIWKNALAVEDDWQGGQKETLITDIAVDRESKPHISYVGAEIGSSNEDTKYAYKTDGQWYDTIIDDGKFQGSINVIDTDLNNRAHIVYNYRPTNEIRYATNTEGIWEKHLLGSLLEEPIFDLETRDIHDINADALGYVHIVYSKEGTLYYVTNKPPAPEPEIIVTPQSIDFVIREVGDTTEAEKVIIKNNGNAILQISDISIVWNDSIHFTITNNTCSNLDPSDTCSVEVVFNPQSFGDKKALLWIESNDPANPTESVILEGKGLAPMVWDYGSLTFGDVIVGDSATNVYTIKNKGNTNLLIQMLTIQEDDAADFYMVDLPDTPFNIGENDSIMFNIVFKPGSVGDKTTILRIFTNDLDLTRILTGTGTPPAFSVDGKVIIDENTPVNDGWVLIHMWDNAEHSAWRTLNYQLSDANEFFFTDIPEGEVTLFVFPDETIYTGYLKTYLGNTAVFDDAEFFYLDKDTSGLEIVVVQAPSPPNGNSEISGVFVEENGNKSGSTLTYGSYSGSGVPIIETSVFLFDQNGNILDLDTTNSTGEFVFENIPVGRYEFVADYVGFSMDDSNDSLIIDQENQKYSIAAIANNNLITIEIENITSIRSFTKNGNIHVYPNPAQDHIILQFTGNQLPNSYTASISDFGGRVIRNSKIELKEAGQEFLIQISDLPAGTYFITLNRDNFKYVAKFIKVE